MEDLNSYIKKGQDYFTVRETPASVVSKLYARLSLTPGAVIPPIPPSLFRMISYRSYYYYGFGGTNRKSFDFMDCLVVAMIESLDWEIHLWVIHLQEVAYLRINSFRLLVELLGELCSWVTEINKVVEYARTGIEASRDPPKIFIPIPKLVESNGCARSDLDPFAYF